MSEVPPDQGDTNDTSGDSGPPHAGEDVSSPPNLPPAEPPAQFAPRRVPPLEEPALPAFEPPARSSPPPPLEPLAPPRDVLGGADQSLEPIAASEPPPQPFVPPPRPVALSTTGVPHFGPPAPPPFSYAPGIGAGETAISPPRRPRSIVRPVVRGVRELAETVILALLIFLLVRAVVQNFQVEGSSMDPTFKDGWYLLVNKAIYWEINLDTIHKFAPFVDPGDDPTRYIFRGPQRGDIIVFHPPQENGEASERDFIKRVIALPGEVVEIHDCTVFIDGEALEEPYLTQPISGTFEPYTVPADHYFVMGDNRNNSSDSRSFSAVPKKNIIGMAWLTYWPLDIFGLVDNHAETPGDVSDQPKSPLACPESAPP